MADVTALKAAAQPSLVVTQEGAVRRIAMNRPPANALSMSFMRDLLTAFRDVAVDRSVHVVVLASAGKHFCAGHDLKEMSAARKAGDRGRAFFAETFALCSELMQAIVNNPKPVIAEVAGVATAAGCQLVASCDLAIASVDAGFATPGVNIGLFCSTPMVALTRNVAPKHAMEMLLTGETVDANTARDFGLVNRVVPAEYLDQVVRKYAGIIASKSPLTVKTGKEAFYRQAEMGLADAYDYAAREMTENMLARDAEEGIGAFIGKRKPEWTGE